MMTGTTGSGSGGGSGSGSGRDLRSTFENTTMDVRGIVQLTQEIWCCLRRRGNTVRKEVAALASPLYALQQSATSRGGSGQQQPQVCQLPVPVCTRIQPESELESSPGCGPSSRLPVTQSAAIGRITSAPETEAKLPAHKGELAHVFPSAAAAVTSTAAAAAGAAAASVSNSAAPPVGGGSNAARHINENPSTTGTAVQPPMMATSALPPVILGRRTPINTPPSTRPVRAVSAAAAAAIKGGLLERRGSNASLTLDLTPSAADSPPIGSPPRESDAEEILTSSSHRMNRRQLSDFLRNPIAISEEFWKIPMNHPGKIEVPGSGIKNRYRTILPNEATRVRLRQLTSSVAGETQASGSPNLTLAGGAVASVTAGADSSLPSTTTAVSSTTYINANYIRGYGGEAHAYIATQGPMSNTVNDFWLMVYQERSPAIVMITKLTEHNRTKCECYMPESSAIYGNLQVTIENQQELQGIIIRHLTLRPVAGASSEPLRTVHYWYTGWPDHRTPDSAAGQLLDLIQLVDQQRIDDRTGRSRGPVIVHCSAGIGRTGCFIAASVALQQLRIEKVVDILGIVCSMRLDRGGMIQTNEQYEFVHRTVNISQPNYSTGDDETQNSPHSPDDTASKGSSASHYAIFS